MTSKQPHSRGAVTPTRSWRPSDPWFFGNPAILGAIVALADGTFLAWTGDGQDTVHGSADEAAAAVRQIHNERKHPAP